MSSQTQSCGCEIYQICPKCNPEWERQTARAAEIEAELINRVEHLRRAEKEAKHAQALEALQKLPVFFDGSDGALWSCATNPWPDILSGKVSANTRLVRVSDVLELLQKL